MDEGRFRVTIQRGQQKTTLGDPIRQTKTCQSCFLIDASVDDTDMCKDCREIEENG
jgi:hypothetical protein